MNEKTEAQPQPTIAESTTKADALQLGTAVIYDGLPTQVIKAPWCPMGVDVVMLAYVPWLVPVDSPELQIMQEPRPPTDAEVNAHHKRNIQAKNYPV